MTDTPLPTRFAEGDFRVGAVLNRTFSVLSRNFLPFFIVVVVANLPILLMSHDLGTAPAEPASANVGASILGAFLAVALNMLSQAIILYGAFQDMRGQRVNLGESLGVGLSRFFPIVGLAIVASLLMGLGFILLIIPGLILMTMWFVATPACVVEQLGPFRSMKRSSQLTKGHRWKIFGLIFVLLIISSIISPTLTVSLAAIGGRLLAVTGSAIWHGVWGAFYAIAVVVTYHDLRVAKEGIDIEQIAAVFD
jgi:MFS family permease